MLKALGLSPQFNRPRYEIGGIASARFAVRCCCRYLPMRRASEREVFARFVLSHAKGEVLSSAEIATLAVDFLRGSGPWRG